MLSGGVYALLAAGFALILGSLRLLNLAHGSLLVVAMAGAWALAAWFEVDPYASLPLLTLLMFAAGWGVFRWFIGPVSRAWGSLGGTLATLALALVVDGSARLLLGSAPRGIDMSYALSLVPIGPYLLPLPKVVGFAGAGGLGFVLWLFMAQTDTGRSIQAVAQDADGARLVGIRPERMHALAYGVGTGCLGAAACLLLPSAPLVTDAGPRFLLLAATGAALGGFGHLGGAVAGGLALGVVEAVSDAVLPSGGAAVVCAALLGATVLFRTMTRLQPARA